MHLRVVEHCAGCGMAMDVTEFSPLSVVTCPDCSKVTRVLRQYQQFVVLHQIGRGGNGAVYRAFDETLQRDVALKLLRSELLRDEAYIARLESEARITASINHPNVVRIYSAGRYNGLCFIAMELCDGTLAEKMEAQGKMPEREVLQLGLECVRGLQATHQARIQHRDVKPGNILFAKGKAKIADLGIAISSGVFGGEERLCGTPCYIAPERVDRSGSDHRSDIYSLGATLFHALAGRPPYSGSSAAEVSSKHVRAQPVSVLTFAPHIGMGTARIVKRMLERDPNRRYQEYEELIADLTNGISQLMDGTAAPSHEEKQLRSAGLLSSWGAWSSAACVLASVFLAGAWASFWSARQGRGQEGSSRAAQPAREIQMVRKVAESSPRRSSYPSTRSAGVPSSAERSWQDGDIFPAGVQVTTGFNELAKASVDFKIESIPIPSSNDAASRGVWIAVGGQPDGNSAPLGVLSDGQLPASSDEPKCSLFFRDGTDGGRLLLDLGRVISIREINSYSWHRDTRAPQVYKVYASDGLPDGSGGYPGIAANPESTGWILVAKVDTRRKGGSQGGQHGVNIAGNGRALGKYRFLLFDVWTVSYANIVSNTFFNEIDVVESDENLTARR